MFFTMGGERYLYMFFNDITKLKAREILLEHEFQAQQSFLDSAADNCIATLQANISENIVERIGGLAPHIKSDAKESYEQAMEGIASSILRKKDVEAFKKLFNRQALLKSFEEGKHVVSYDYLFKAETGEPIWLRTTGNLIQRHGDGAIIMFNRVTNVNAELVPQLVMSEVLKVNFEGVYLLYTEFNYGLNVHQGLHTSSFAEGYDRITDFAKAIKDFSHEFVHPDDQKIFEDFSNIKNIVKGLDTKDRLSLMIRLYHNGQLHYKRFDIYWLSKEDGMLILVRMDVTDTQKAISDKADQLRVALNAAEQASVAKTQFLSRMSHEIRTPMNAIIGLDAIALQEKGLSPQMIDHLQKIGISARFLLSLINDILDMSRIESGKMTLKPEPFNFEEFINGIDTILYEQCRNNSLNYESVLKSVTEEEYVGDVTKLQQVLINILGNAVKFTPKGGQIHFMIEQVSHTADKAKLRFEISDTGIGIDDKFMPHLFEAFSQESRGSTSSYGGTGLGLAISKNIMNMMGGTITAHSIKNVGSSFIVEVELGLTPNSIKNREMLKIKNLKPLFTLIVDDDAVVCRHTQIILNEAGLKAEWVDSGAAAVSQVKEYHKQHKDYDLILLDWKMPDMDGIETARQIRKVVGPEVTIIIMTAYDWAEIEKKAREAGVDLFMRKPIFASSVTKAFESVFHKKLNNAEKSKSQPEPQFDFSGRRVLLAEDNEINAEIAKNILQMKGCAVDVVGNGAEAIEAFAATAVNYYDAIIMDVRMPVMDGLEATKTIRAMKKKDSKKIPIIAMTANAFQEDIEKSMAAGMNAHLAKPIEPITIYRTLEKFLADK